MKNCLIYSLAVIDTFDFSMCSIHSCRNFHCPEFRRQKLLMGL